MLMCRETIAKTSEVQRYVLNNAAKFGVGFWGGLSLQELLRSLFSSQVLPIQLTDTAHRHPSFSSTSEV